MKDEFWRRQHADGIVAEVKAIGAPPYHVEIRQSEGPSIPPTSAEDLDTAKEIADTTVAALPHFCSDACGLWTRL